MFYFSLANHLPGGWTPGYALLVSAEQLRQGGAARVLLTSLRVQSGLAAAPLLCALAAWPAAAPSTCGACVTQHTRGAWTTQIAGVPAGGANVAWAPATTVAGATPAAWHVSYFLDAEGMRRKLLSFAHTGLETWGLEAGVDSARRAALDPLGRPDMRLHKLCVRRAPLRVALAQPGPAEPDAPEAAQAGPVTPASRRAFPAAAEALLPAAWRPADCGRGTLAAH
jgi:hypothetical protein